MLQKYTLRVTKCHKLFRFEFGAGLRIVPFETKTASILLRTIRERGQNGLFVTVFTNSVRYDPFGTPDSIDRC